MSAVSGLYFPFFYVSFSHLLLFFNFLFLSRVIILTSFSFSSDQFSFPAPMFRRTEFFFSHCVYPSPHIHKCLLQRSLFLSCFGLTTPHVIYFPAQFPCIFPVSLFYFQRSLFINPRLDFRIYGSNCFNVSYASLKSRGLVFKSCVSESMIITAIAGNVLFPGAR